MTGGAVVYCLDLPRMRAFYAGVGELPVIEDGPGFVTFGHAGTDLSLVQAPPDVVAAAGPTTARRVDNPVKLVLPVAALAAARLAAPGLGGQLDPAERTWTFRGGRICDGVDPEGNVVAFREPV